MSGNPDHGHSAQSPGSPPKQADSGSRQDRAQAIERIVIVDDDASMRKMLSRLLQPLGHEIQIAESAGQVLDIAGQGPVDLVVSDLKMPNMDGLALLQEMRARGSDAAFILLTAFGELDAVLMARDRFELSNFFVKPIVSQDKFLFDVTTALQKRRLALENRRLIQALAVANQGLEEKVEERTRDLIGKNEELFRLSQFRAEVLTVLSHELRTPMALLKGYIDLVLEVEPSERGPSFQVMRHAVDRVQEIVDQAIQLKRASAPTPFAMILRETDPNAPCALAVARIQPLVERRRVVIHFQPTHCPPVHWDARWIESVIEELLINAVRASRDGMHVRVGLSSEPESVRIRVSDEGVGIPEPERDRIFEPFVTLGKAERHHGGQFGFRAQGAGLGLAVAKLWVELHRGSLTVQAHEDRPGTTFIVELPRHPEPPNADALALE